MEIGTYYMTRLTHIPVNVFDLRISQIGDSLKGIRDLDTQIQNISLLLFVFDITDKKLKTLSKLHRDAKYGFVSEFLTKSARHIGIPNKVIQRYTDIRDTYRSSRNNRWCSDVRKMEIKRELRDETFFLMDLCLDEYSIKKLREMKIESLLK